MKRRGHAMIDHYITVKVPKRKIIRVKRIHDPDRPKKRIYLLDFRGIRVPKNPKNYKPYKTDNWGGNKPKFDNPDQLQKLCDEYFESCMGPILYKGKIVRDHNGEIIIGNIKPLTVSGLALYLGITTSTLWRWAQGTFDNSEVSVHNRTYSEILNLARQRIENYAETRLYDRDGVYGARFVLDTSFGWVTQKEKAEIKEKEFNMKLKKMEFELKKSLAEMGESADNLEIRIVRKTDEN